MGSGYCIKFTRLMKRYKISENNVKEEAKSNVDERKTASDDSDG